MCIFCNIVKKEIHSFNIYEDDEILAFLDISQVTKGHTLIIPKQHCASFLECDDKTIAHLIKAAKLIANRLIECSGAVGMNVLSNINEVAGQSVPHFHVHLIPRYSDEDACVIQFLESSEQNLEELAALLQTDKN